MKTSNRGIAPRKRVRGILFSGWLIFSICTSAQAIVTSDGPGTHVVSQMDDTYGVNLDGVVLIGGVLEEGPTGFCSGALITDRHVLTAAHCFDTNGDLQIEPILFLFPSEVLFEIDGNLIPVDYDPAKIKWSEDWEISRADIAVVTLEADPPPDVPRYPLYGGIEEIGQPFVLAGYGYPGFGPTGYDPDFDAIRTKRAGLNRYEDVAEVEDAEFLVFDFDSGQPEHNVLEIVGLPSDLGFGADEVLFAEHDSGAAGFLNGAIASVVAFSLWLPDVSGNAATDKPDSSWGEFGFTTRVSNFRDFILTATDGEAVFVMPGEPSILGDLDNDQLLTAGDMDILSRAIRFGINDVSFDLNDDDDVSQLDRETWIQDLLGTFFGDADLNLAVEYADFFALSENFGKAGGWGEGDFDGDGIVQFTDFVVLADNFGKSTKVVSAVPEPCGALMFVVGVVIVVCCHPIVSETRYA